MLVKPFALSFTELSRREKFHFAFLASFKFSNLLTLFLFPAILYVDKKYKIN
jgi:hypothetical protein